VRNAIRKYLRQGQHRARPGESTWELALASAAYQAQVIAVASVPDIPAVTAPVPVARPARAAASVRWQAAWAAIDRREALLRACRTPTANYAVVAA
jgi:hypothetical protein